MFSDSLSDILYSSPSVTPSPEQKAVWDSLLNRVGKIRSLSKKERKFRIVIFDL